jgi:hypothetical protein
MDVDKTIEMEPTKEPVIGQFKPKRKFLNFISSLSGVKVRFIRDVAFIKGEKLSGTLEGVKFKITICDEGTINFEEVDTNVSNPEQIQRLIDDIDIYDVIGYSQKFVVSGLEFTDIDGNRCYLEVEHQKPIDSLRSILDEKPTLSTKSKSLLDDLLGSNEVQDSDETQDETPVKKTDKKEQSLEEVVQPSETYLESEFRKMNENKIKELNSRIESTKEDIRKIKRTISSNEGVLDTKTKELKVLEGRLDSFDVKLDPNGWVFNVSEEIKNELGLKDEDKEIVNKISDIMNLKKDALFKMLTEGYYRIRISKKGDYESEVKPDAEILELMKFDVLGKMVSSTPGEFEYRGELNWHNLVNKMIRNGFEQDPEFDKICQSNSYQSKEEEQVGSSETETEQTETKKEKNGLISKLKSIFTSK